MKILTIGSATEDIFLRPQQADYKTIERNGVEQDYLLIEKGCKLDLQDVTLATGGAATNCAVTFKGFGFEVSVWSIIGDDYSGEFIINTLERYKIPTDLIVKNEKLPTTRSFIFAFPDGDRSILTNRAAQKDFSLDMPDAILEAQESLYISGLTPKAHAQLFQLLQRAKELKIFIAANPSSYQLTDGITEFIKCLPFIDLLILNRTEAELLVTHLNNGSFNSSHQPDIAQHQVFMRPFVQKNGKSYSARDVFAYFYTAGLTTVIITDGKNGIYASDGSALYYHTALPADKIVNTVGAGDAFGSACCAALLEKHTLPEALIFGLCNSRSVISKLDAKSGIVDKQELAAQVKAIGTHLLQTFIW